jgi:hypothetical protein
MLRVIQTRPEIGWNSDGAKRSPRSDKGGTRTQCVCVGVGDSVVGPLTGESAGREASPAQYWREAK